MPSKTAKRFNGARFFSADSRYIGPAPWDQRLSDNAAQIVPQTIVTVDEPTSPNDLRIPRFHMNDFILRRGLPRLPLFRIARHPLASSFWVAAFTISVISLSAILFNTRANAFLRCFPSRLIDHIGRNVLPASWDNLNRWKLAQLARAGVSSALHGSSLLSLSLRWIFNPSTAPILPPAPPPDYSDVPSSFHNFASVNRKASILPQFTSSTHNLTEVAWYNRLKSHWDGYIADDLKILSPYVILEDEMKEGECWRVSGSAAQVGIKLSDAALVTHIGVDYISPHLLTLQDIASAPQKMTLWASVDKNHQNQETTQRFIAIQPSQLYTHQSPASTRKVRGSATEHDDPRNALFVQVAEFAYNISHTTQRQIFPVRPLLSTKSRFVVLKSESNEGGNTTCLYSVAVFGI